MTTLEDALALAVEAHRGQRDIAGQPYILRPLRVMFRVETEEERTVAILHDVVEDTPITLDDLRARGFSPRVVAAVDALSRRDGETYEAFVARAGADALARRVKLADLEDNMDVRRMAVFTAADAERMARYLTAWRALKDVAGYTGP